MGEGGQDWIEALGGFRMAGRACVMVVVTEVRGSAPREAGARMLVGADGELAHGTIGGGHLELQAIEHATRLLGRDDGASECVDFPLAEKTGQCCGGAVTLFFEPFRWQRKSIAVFGAGHVGQALGGLAPWMGADVMVIDSREEALIRPRIPADRPYELICVDAPAGEIDLLPSDAAIVVMTHSHALDFEIIERVLQRGRFAFVGLIGSERKWVRFRKRLEQRGYSPEAIDKVTCPIGVSRGSKEPSAIALSTATQLVDVLAR
ncbi:MAG: xanthine dehydrogenase accessory protein XdhC [Planctomycetes bacterium]|jgi:xanthine dehydrogenase accessory factor|nr:xanthine dehydrogenase accessory protein XdhC [Planctomycetota bacterium]